MNQLSPTSPATVTNFVTITEIIDDLRAAEEMVRRFERLYWLSSADFYDLYAQGLLDDGENSEDFAVWAGFHLIKVDREAALQALSHERTAKLRQTAPAGYVQIHPMEPALQIA